MENYEHFFTSDSQNTKPLQKQMDTKQNAQLGGSLAVVHKNCTTASVSFLS